MISPSRVMQYSWSYWYQRWDFQERKHHKIERFYSSMWNPGSWVNMKGFIFPNEAYLPKNKQATKHQKNPQAWHAHPDDFPIAFPNKKNRLGVSSLVPLLPQRQLMLGALIFASWILLNQNRNSANSYQQRKPTIWSTATGPRVAARSSTLSAKLYLGCWRHTLACCGLYSTGPGNGKRWACGHE